MVARDFGNLESMMYDDEDPEEIDDSVERIRRMSLTGSFAPPTPDASRGSRLTGFKVPQPEKNRRGMLKTVMKSRRNLGSQRNFGSQP